MEEEIIIHQCSHVGVSGTTPVHIKKHNDEKFEARCGIALIGTMNMTPEQYDACDHNPFHEKFNDNFCRGEGKTEAEAIENLKIDMHMLSNALWSI